ncbi:hypothetical protein NHX12_027684 [Muraenolepis orangiensis]|uniref:Uncharacterized protein n=1 Tax=Muraenolepis orangiensis TaxID=630683 RepID=A0A9Q0EF81_9TELE|nr:hypothetical protein NHX12_027684 [Muraenolepis orangiensis]
MSDPGQGTDGALFNQARVQTEPCSTRPGYRRSPVQPGQGTDGALFNQARSSSLNLKSSSLNLKSSSLNLKSSSLNLKSSSLLTHGSLPS